MNAQPSQLDDIVAFLTRVMPARTLDYFNADMTAVQLIPSTKSLGLGYYRLGILRYTATISWNGFPYREYPPAMIWAHLLSWLHDHRNEVSSELELPMPTIDPLFIDEWSSDIDIDIELADEITIQESSDGEIEFMGKRWRLLLPETSYATEHVVRAAMDSAP
ncbi:TPA: phage tail protein [Enterobacter kobei]|nr:phage tail protein [Enterobacter kobei]